MLTSERPRAAFSTIETTDLNIIFEDETELNNVKPWVDISITEQQTGNQTQNEVINETQNQTTNEIQNEIQNEIPNEIPNEKQNKTANEIPQNTNLAQNNNIKNDTSTTNIVDRDPTTAKKDIPYTGVTYTILIVAMAIAIVAGIIRIVIKYYDKQ